MNKDMMFLRLGRKNTMWNKIVTKIKKATNIKAWLILNISFGFMICIFAPIEAYYTNKNEFWFNIQQLLSVSVPVFVITTIILMVIFFYLSMTKYFEYFYVFLSAIFLYFYIQGNYIPRKYGILNGVDINWSSYTQYGIASILVFLFIVFVFVLMLFKFKKNIFKIGIYLSIFILAIQLITIVTLIIQNYSIKKEYNSCMVTDNSLLEYSKNHNVIVFILDTFDTEYFKALLKEDYETYSNIFENFTLYEDTLGAYPTTKGAMPYILTGKWYENEQPYTKYVQNAYENNDIYKSLEDNEYSVGIYTSGLYLDDDIDIYDNVEQGTYEIKSLTDFAKKLYNMVAFNYMPHQLKKYFIYNTDDFSELRKVSGNYQVFSPDVQKFARRLSEEEILSSKEKDCFRLYHLDGTHAPFTFGKDLISDNNTTYDAYDEAAGNCILMKKYFDKLRNAGLYDKTDIVILADHGNIGYSQNPIFMVKNANELHEFKISNTPMTYEYLSDIWIALINRENVDEQFISSRNQTKVQRRYLYYSWDDLWDREYLPMIQEMFLDGSVSNLENLKFSGVQYEAEKSNDYLYPLGTELSFTADKATAKYYFVSGLSVCEQFGTWTNGNQAVMKFDISGEDYDNLLLTLESGIYLSQQKVIFYVNDQEIAIVKFNGLEKKMIVIPKEYVVDDIVKITMELPDACSPHSIDENNGDYRLLALSMRSIKLESIDKEFDLTDQMTEKYKLGSVLSFTNTDNSAKQYYESGFSSTEDEFTWTDAKVVEMIFIFDKKPVDDLILEYTYTPFNEKQHVILYANNNKLADYDSVTTETKQITIPIEYIEEGKLTLKFELPDAISPKEIGMNEDTRTLGLAMRSLKIS